MNSAQKVTPSPDTVDGRLISLAKAATEILSRATTIADRIGGPVPQDQSGNQVAAVPTSTLDHLREIDRTLYRAYEALARAENSLG